MAGGMQGKTLQATYLVGIAIGEELVELRAVALEFRTLVENLAECVLHGENVLADADFAAQFLLNVGRARKVVGMDMRLDDPFQRQVMFANKGDHGVGALKSQAARCRIEFHDRINHRAGLAPRVANHIADGVRLFVKKPGDFGFGCKIDGRGHHDGLPALVE